MHNFAYVLCKPTGKFITSANKTQHEILVLLSVILL